MTTRTAENLKRDPGYYKGVSWRLLISTVLNECSLLEPEEEGHITSRGKILLKSFLGSMAGRFERPQEFLVLNDRKTRAFSFYQRGTIGQLDKLLTYIKDKGYADVDETSDERSE